MSPPPVCKIMHPFSLLFLGAISRYPIMNLSLKLSHNLPGNAQLLMDALASCASCTALVRITELPLPVAAEAVTVQGWAKKWFPGFMEFVPALAYASTCLATWGPFF